MTKEKMIAHKDSVMWQIVKGDLSQVNGKTAFDAKRAGDEAGRELWIVIYNTLAAGLLMLLIYFSPRFFVLAEESARKATTS